ncbi:hypothetical protein A1O7_07402 [Cladophialophora yegresii CBS 114405]|uniref:Amidohydrolase-related domain-containing protein n=1 Tax=Cladophialophora yegresii CBS 114405 TaxID=1182544 RepID=W9VNF0_9EURO|nr:uncharacterized protein A1O7_07402 [Cladophialophora yegresii CBS 114405]EXJ57058.1 hypothetical protein A1O7_07402 [Cladophialophora yegresii CBS 114405]
MANEPPKSSILLRGGTVLTHDKDDHVVVLRDTDVLIRNDIIEHVGENIDPPSSSTQVIDCKGKIVSPGFVDTHHHLWQTQLKGRHAEQGLVAYMYSGNMMSYAYKPEDTYWGQLSGCLEAIHAGTTTVLDHAHCVYTPDHATSALQATIDSGIRAVFGYTVATRMARWDQAQCVPEQDLVPEWAVQQLGDLLENHNNAASLVEIGMGFDLWFLPKDMVLGMFQTLRQKGLRLVTSHVARNAFMGLHSHVQLLQSYDLLRTPYPPSESSASMPYLLLSHCNGISHEDMSTLATTGTPISSTPGSESQMGMGFPVGLDPALKAQESAHVSLGVDCHTNDPSSILLQARMLLQLTRVQKNARIGAEGKYPSENVTGTSEEAFNLATIRGARCLGLGDAIGSIEAGKKADLVVFDAAGSVGMLSAIEYDPVVAIVRFSEAADIEHVIVNGVLRKRGGKLVATDISLDKKGPMEWKETAEQVRRSQRDIQQRIDGLSLQKARETLLGMYHTDTSRLVDAE